MAAPFIASAGTLNDRAAKLRTLSDDDFRRAIHTLSLNELNHETRRLFDALRPLLREVRPPRPWTLQRLYYLPHQEYLDDDPIAAGNRIPRSVLALCWEELQKSASKILRKLRDRLSHISAGADIMQIGYELWCLATARIKSAPPVALS